MEALHLERTGMPVAAAWTPSAARLLSGVEDAGLVWKQEVVTP